MDEANGRLPRMNGLVCPAPLLANLDPTLRAVLVTYRLVWSPLESILAVGVVVESHCVLFAARQRTSVSLKPNVAAHVPGTAKSSVTLRLLAVPGGYAETSTGLPP